MGKPQFKTIHFKSTDGLLITAEYYPVKKPQGFILLCHRSHCNRAEYRETAPKLNDLGYCCLAIDQRSGMKVFGAVNETKNRAKEKGLKTGYLDAKPDIKAAICHSFELNDQNPIVLLGSSYSASMALLLAAKMAEVKAVVAFSPGEYLKGINLADQIRSIDKPIFVTGAKKEVDQVEDVAKNIHPRFVTLFKPDVAGFHGSKTLWDQVKGSETYWNALEQFLSDNCG